MSKNQEQRLRIGQRFAEVRKSVVWTDEKGIKRKGMTQTELSATSPVWRMGGTPSASTSWKPLPKHWAGISTSYEKGGEHKRLTSFFLSVNLKRHSTRLVRKYEKDGNHIRSNHQSGWAVRRRRRRCVLYVAIHA